MQALPNCSIAETEQQKGAGGGDKEEEQQQAPSPAKAGGLFGRTQTIKAQPPKAKVILYNTLQHPVLPHSAQGLADSFSPTEQADIPLTNSSHLDLKLDLGLWSLCVS